MEIKSLYELFLQHPVVTTDSRDCPEGSLFFALKGESFDGNRFAAAALEKGCAYAVVDDAAAVIPQDERYILVDNVLTTLQCLAREHRRALDLPIIGITGTNGKTTTKELIATVLSRKYNTLFTQGNFNNDIGVPKTLLRLTPDHEMAVVEMGASHPGDIKTLVEIVEPNYGLITNVGMAHLQGFGSFEGVKRTKGELYDFLRKHDDSVVFLNADNEHLVEMAQGLDVVPYSSKGNYGNVVCGEVVECNPLLKMRWRLPALVGEENPWHEVQTQLIGAYNIDNVMAAVTVGLYFGVDEDEISAALEAYKPSNNRSQLTVTERNRLIVDAYNANPTSMRAAIENFSLIPAEKKLLILGDMGELGAESAQAHQDIVSLLEKEKFTDVWLVGQEFGKISCNYRKFTNAEEVKQTISREQPQDYLILIKGSNFMHLAQLQESL